MGTRLQPTLGGSGSFHGCNRVQFLPAAFSACHMRPAFSAVPASPLPARGGLLLCGRACVPVSVPTGVPSSPETPHVIFFYRGVLSQDFTCSLSCATPGSAVVTDAQVLGL